MNICRQKVKAILHIFCEITLFTSITRRGRHKLNIFYHHTTNESSLKSVYKYIFIVNNYSAILVILKMFAINHK